MKIALPYTPYRIEVDGGSGRTATVNLSANSSDLRGGYFGPGARWRAMLVSRAKQQMHDDAYMLVLNAPGRATVPRTGHLRVDVVVSTRTRARHDQDGAWAGLKWALDGLAQGLGRNDRDFLLGDLTFEQGEPESTTIEVRGP